MVVEMEKKEFTFIDYLYILVKWRKFLIINFFIVCFFAGIIGLILPRWYTAETVILPTAGSGDAMGISSMLSNLPMGGLGLGLGGVSEETNTFIAILNSRTMLETVAKEFDLINRYEARNMEEAVKALRGNIQTDISEEGTLVFRAKASTPYFSSDEEKNGARVTAKDITNFFIKELDRFNKQLKSDKAKSTRIFLEKRYKQNLTDLKRAEDELKNFQEKFGAIAVPEQVVATITIASELKAQIIAKELEVSGLRKYVSENHPTLLKAQNELTELHEKYSDFLIEKKVSNNSNNSTPIANDIFLPLENIPQLGIEYLRLYREVTLQEKILEFLLPQYEQAKIQEAKDTPTLQILDEAVLPIHKSSPKVLIIVIGAGFSCLILSLIFILIIEFLARTENENSEQIREIKLALKNDIKKMLPFK